MNQTNYEAHLVLEQPRTLVMKFEGEYLPLFAPKDVGRDKFMQLRKELINLGCHQDEVIHVAKRLSMMVLEIEDEKEYNAYVLNQTHQQCNEIIKNGWSILPIQDLNHNKYSHIELFSSIYGFEINYLQERKITNGVADLGCGDGLFLKLLNDKGISAVGYEIELKKPSHSVPIRKIESVHDIQVCHPVFILNHVLEHIDESPNLFLSKLIDHVDGLTTNAMVQTIIISLPIHLSLSAHLASGHKRVCYDEEISNTLKNIFEKKNLALYNPDIELAKVAKEKGFNFNIHKNIGIYVFERDL
jgi:hypothetical protein